jgi:hypothetical protein
MEQELMNAKALIEQLREEMAELQATHNKLLEVSANIYAKREKEIMILEDRNDFIIDLLTEDQVEELMRRDAQAKEDFAEEDEDEDEDKLICERCEQEEQEGEEFKDYGGDLICPKCYTEAEDSCDCCVKGWSKPNEFGRCVCRCSDCKKLLRNCRYECTAVKQE